MQFTNGVGIQTVTFFHPARNVVVDVRSGECKTLPENRCRRDPIHIVIAVDGDPPFFVDCRYPGHATYGTGCYPSRHGIVANDFRDGQRGSWTYCAGDEDARPITRFGREEDADDYRVSPRNLLVDGGAAWFRRSWPGSRSVSIAGKDRSAILMAGRGAEDVLWWDRYQAGFTTSDHYGDALPDFAAAWNEGWRERCEDFVWTPLIALDALEGTGTASDLREGEAACSKNGTTFPHPAPGLSEEPKKREVYELAKYVYRSPLSDRFVLDLAWDAVVARDLGGDEDVDLLCLSFSACDTVGHLTGPYSAETTDVLLRLDRELGAFFDLLDERVGADGWVASLSSDHGVLELPEHRRALGQPGARLPKGAIQEARGRLRDALESRFGEHFQASLGGGGAYLSKSRLEASDASPAEVRSFARDWLVREVEWITAGFTSDELNADDAPADDVFFTLARRSTQPTRGPDVALRVTPWTLIDRQTGTTHGTPYDYDRRIPLAFLGAPFAAGESWEPADSVDALPTLLHALGVAYDVDAFDGQERTVP